MNFDEAFKLIDPIDGHMRPAESRWIYDTVLALPDKCRVLEIGVWAGRTTVLMALAARQKGGQVVGIDSREKAVCSAGRNAGTAGLNAFVARGNWQAAPDDMDIIFDWSVSPNDLKDCPADYFDMVFIDGNHSSDCVALDIMASTRVLKPGGLLCGHDYRIYGVRAVVDYMVRCADKSVGGSYFNCFSAEMPGSIWHAYMTRTPKWDGEALLFVFEEVFNNHKMGGASLRRLVENMRERMP